MMNNKLTTLLVFFLLTITKTTFATTYYVDKDVTGGLNTGASWADAYSHLNSAISVAGPNDEIWVAEGTYLTPNNSFNITTISLNIYGGFNGTETSRSQRDWFTNQTILSADALGNDNNNIDLTEPTRSDNNETVVVIGADNILLDGLIIEGGHSNSGTAGQNRYGGGIYVTSTVTTFTINNCEIRNNCAAISGGLHYTFTATNSTLNIIIENTIFHHNKANHGGAFGIANEGTNTTLYAKLHNSLIYKNECTTFGSTFNNTRGGSAGSILANGASNISNLTVDNCTFVGNISETTGSGVQAVFNFSSLNSGTCNLAFDNTIFDNNIGDSLIYYNNAYNLANTLTLRSSIIQADVNSVNWGTTVNTSGCFSTTPQFTNAANDDYRQVQGSSGIDAGNNSLVPTGLLSDLSGNNRIVNSTIDLGCYEYDPSLFIPTYNTSKTAINLFPNPTHATINIDLEEVKEQIEIKVLNTLGQVIIVETYHNQQYINLDINGDTGLYLVYINLDNQEEQSFKVIKN